MFTLDICRWALKQQRLGDPHESENKCCLLQMCNACDWSCLTPLNSPPTHLSINTHGFKSGGCRGATSVWLWFTQMKERLKGRKTFRDTGHKVAGCLQCWTHWIKHWCVTLRSNWWPRLRAEGRVTQPFSSFYFFPWGYKTIFMRCGCYCGCADCSCVSTLLCIKSELLRKALPPILLPIRHSNSHTSTSSAYTHTSSCTWAHRLYQLLLNYLCLHLME